MRDIAGNYSLPGGGLAAFGEKPLASAKWNANFNDIAAEIQDSLSRSGKGAMQANLNMGGFSITNALNVTLTGALVADTMTLSGAATAASFAGSGASLTALNATQLTSGTVPDARFPATLPAISGANLTNLNATQLTSGTVPDARFPATLPAASGINLTALNASALGSGTAPPSRLGSGTPSPGNFLRGDGTWSHQIRSRFDIDGAAGTDRAILGTTNGVARWALVLGQSDAELGSNTGSSFLIGRYSDTGAWLDIALHIDRATGVISGNGGGFTNLNGSNIAGGTVAVARLGSGTPTESNFLRGDGTWQSVAGVTAGAAAAAQLFAAMTLR